jgi:hypothetical protein
MHIERGRLTIGATQRAAVAYFKHTPYVMTFIGLTFRPGPGDVIRWKLQTSRTPGVTAHTFGPVVFGRSDVLAIGR